MFDAYLFIATILAPLIGAGVVCALAGRGRALARQAALVASIVALLGAAVLAARFTPGEDFAVGVWPWLGSGTGLKIDLAIGLDGLSIWLFVLSAVLTVTSVLVSWEAIEERAAAFYALLLLLETGLLGVFAARDLILFYVFFEFTLIPLFFLIGVWGSEERRRAAVKFFIFTLAGSLLTFLGLLAIVLWNAQGAGDGTITFSIPELTAGLAQLRAIDPNVHLQTWIFLALLAGFAVKAPMFPLHTWLPLAHVQAPTAGSVMLAGVLLKIGTYGFVRFSLPMLPDATALLAPYLLWLCAAGIIYGALVALAQSDIKKLIAYSSVSHLGFCLLGLFALNRLGMQGGVLQMINHGLSTGGLFACVGMIYERFHTRKIRDLGGLAAQMPVLAFFMLLFTMSSIGLPGLNGFVGEFLLLVGMFQRAWTDTGVWAFQLQAIAVLSMLGVVLGAWYMLWMVQRTFFGPIVHPPGAHDEPIRDLAPREILALAPLAVLIVWIGVQPRAFLDPMAPTLDPVADVVAEAFATGPAAGGVLAQDERLGIGMGESPGVDRAERSNTDTLADAAGELRAAGGEAGPR